MASLEGDAVISLQWTIFVWPLEVCQRLSGVLRACADRVKDCQLAKRMLMDPVPLAQNRQMLGRNSQGL